MLNRRSLLTAAAAGSSLLALTACTKQGVTDPAEAEAATANGGTLSFAIQNPTGIEPYTSEDENALAVVYQLFDPLTRYNPDTQELEPCIATAWSSNDDATEWIFTIREGVTFHDGTACDAPAFKRAWDRLTDPEGAGTASALAYHLSMVKGYDEQVAGNADGLSGIACPDDHTLVVTMSKPYADFPYVCSLTTLGPVPECALEDHEAYRLAPVGNGAFRMSGQWEDGQYVDLVHYDGYWGEPALLDGLHFGIFRDNLTSYTEVKAGSCDNSVVPAAQMAQAQEDYGVAENDGYTSQPGAQVFMGEMLYTQYFVYNMDDPVIGGDVRIRQALSYAVNRQAICDNVYMGSAYPAEDIVPRAIAGSSEGHWPVRHDPDLAGQLLDDAGYPADADGRRHLAVTLMTNAAYAKEEYEAMIADWDAIGIDATMDRVEYAAMLDNYYSGNFMVATRGWYADYPIADNYLYPLFASASSDNMSHFKDDAYDEMIAAARATLDADERAAAMSACDAYVAEQLPVAPLNWKAISRCSSARVHDLTITPQVQPVLVKARVDA